MDADRRHDALLDRFQEQLQTYIDERALQQERRFEELRQSVASLLQERKSSQALTRALADVEPRFAALEQSLQARVLKLEAQAQDVSLAAVSAAATEAGAVAAAARAELRAGLAKELMEELMMAEQRLEARNKVALAQVKEEATTAMASAQRLDRQDDTERHWAQEVQCLRADLQGIRRQLDQQEQPQRQQPEPPETERLTSLSMLCMEVDQRALVAQVQQLSARLRQTEELASRGVDGEAIQRLQERVAEVEAKAGRQQEDTKEEVRRLAETLRKSEEEREHQGQDLSAELELLRLEVTAKLKSAGGQFEEAVRSSVGQRLASNAEKTEGLAELFRGLSDRGDRWSHRLGMLEDQMAELQGSPAYHWARRWTDANQGGSAAPSPRLTRPLSAGATLRTAQGHEEMFLDGGMSVTLRAPSGAPPHTALRCKMRNAKAKPPFVAATPSGRFVVPPPSPGRPVVFGPPG